MTLRLTDVAHTTYDVATNLASLRLDSDLPAVTAHPRTSDVLRQLPTDHHRRGLCQPRQHPLLTTDVFRQLPGSHRRRRLRQHPVMGIDEIEWRLWAFRGLLPPQARLPEPAPWNGEPNTVLLGPNPRRRSAENRTPRVQAATMEPLLAWALRFAEDFAADITAAVQEVRPFFGAQRGRDRKGPPPSPHEQSPSRRPLPRHHRVDPAPAR
jgi:hypothetical protein